MNRFNLYTIRASRVFPAMLLVILLMTVPGLEALAQDAGEQGEFSLEEYAGSYGPRKILLMGDKLMYKRDEMPTAVPMEEIGDDSFEIIIPAGAQVRGQAANGPLPIFVFNRNDDGDIVSLSLVDGDGNILSTSDRDKEESG
jgi:hypothetical protein